MTQPRHVRPGVTWFVTRRTTRRHHLFSPDEEGTVEQLYWYTTAVVANKLGVQLHMTQVMSTHPHEVLTDTKGVLPRFFELRNRILANGLKVLRGWVGEVFDKRPANWVEVGTADALVYAMAYTATNCVAAGLVRTPQRWPGVKVLADEVGQRAVTVRRPDGYFDAANPEWPDEITIPIVMPELALEAYGSEEAAREAIQVEMDRLVRKAHDENLRAGRGYAGAKRVLKASHTKRANSPEPIGARNPTFAARGNRSVASAFVARLREFRRMYRKAWGAWKSGRHDVLFPPGTWKMREYHAARCHSPP